MVFSVLRHLRARINFTGWILGYIFSGRLNRIFNAQLEKLFFFFLFLQFIVCWKIMSTHFWEISSYIETCTVVNTFPSLALTEKERLHKINISYSSTPTRHFNSKKWFPVWSNTWINNRRIFLGFSVNKADANSEWLYPEQTSDPSC